MTKQPCVLSFVYISIYMLFMCTVHAVFSLVYYVLLVITTDVNGLSYYIPVCTSSGGEAPPTSETTSGETAGPGWSPV